RSSGSAYCGSPRGGRRPRTWPRRCPRRVRSGLARSYALERHPLASQLDLAGPGGAELVRSGEHTFQLLVRVERIVVEEHEPPGASSPRERHGILGARMPPADPVVVLRLRVLGVMQEHRRSLSQGEPGDPLGLYLGEIRAERGFVIGEIRERLAVLLDAVPDGRAGMLDEVRGDVRRADPPRR